VERIFAPTHRTCGQSLRSKWALFSVVGFVEINFSEVESSCFTVSPNATAQVLLVAKIILLYNVFLKVKKTTFSHDELYFKLSKICISCELYTETTMKTCRFDLKLAEPTESNCFHLQEKCSEWSKILWASEQAVGDKHIEKGDNWVHNLIQICQKLICTTNTSVCFEEVAEHG